MADAGSERAKEEISDLLEKMTKDHDVKLLFAVESGSREWGFASDDSDYDVRAVHFGAPEKYLGLTLPKENIEVMVKTEPKIDIVSWDIKKFAGLFLKSNPTVSEWLQSKIVYTESDYRREFRTLFEQGFSRFALKKHYIGLARENYERYARNKNEVNLKKYVYILRALACVEYLTKEEGLPPLNYKEVLPYLPETMATFTENVVARKRAAENLTGSANKEANAFVESQFDRVFEKTEHNFNNEQISDLVVKIIEGK